MRLLKISPLRNPNSQHRGNDFMYSLYEEFRMGLNRWSEWANFIANRFKQVPSPFLSPERYFLRSLPLTHILRQCLTNIWHFTHLSLRLAIKPVLTKIARQIVHNGPKGFLTISIAKRPGSEPGLSKQFGFGLNKTKSLRIFERLRRIEVRNVENVESTKYLSESTFNYVARNESFVKRHADMKSMNPRDDLGMEEGRFHLAKNSPPMIYHRLSPHNTIIERPSENFPRLSENRVHEPMQKKELSTPVNIDSITEEVIRQIDRRLLIWRERTGKV